MKTIQKILIVLVIVTTALSSFASDNDDSNDARLKAAKRYLQVTPMSKMVDDTINEMAQKIAPDKRNDFVTYMKSMIRADMLEEIAIDSMVEIFSAEELNALADFYGSVMGKSIMNKFGSYMAEVMPALQKELMRSLQKLQAEGRLQ